MTEHTRTNHEVLDYKTMVEVDLKFWRMLGSEHIITHFPPDRFAVSRGRRLVSRYRDAVRRLKESE